jgi:hypothetical protein
MIGGGAIVAVLSGITGAGCSRVRSTGLAWILALTTPAVIAYSVYWAPVWMGSPPSEFAAWAPLFIAPWYLVGAFVSAVGVYAARARASRPSPGRADPGGPAPDSR